jgi:arylsulfatase
VGTASNRQIGAPLVWSTTPRPPSGATQCSRCLQPRHLPQLDSGPGTASRGGFVSAPSTKTSGSHDTNTDWTQSKDLAKENPQKLAELQRLFLIEATKYSVLPLDDRTFERFNSELAGRPQLIKGKTQMLFGGMSRLSEGSMVVTHNKSYSITAEIEVPKSGANGVIVAIGGGVGGWSLYALNGKLKHCYNFFGIHQYFAEGTQPIPAGKHQVRMEFKYDGGGLAKGGDVSLFVDGKKDGGGRVDQTVPMIFSADETCDVGKETGSTVSPDYGPTGNEFSGAVNWVQIDLEKDDHDHLIAPEERLRLRWRGSKCPGPAVECDRRS